MNLQEEMLKIKNEMIDEFDKRVEALKVDEQEFPKDGDKYWYIGKIGTGCWGVWEDSSVDKHLKSIGNVFETEGEAEFAVEKLKVEAELRKFSRPFKRGRFNHYIFIDTDGNHLEVNSLIYGQPQGTIYFESEEKAKQAIQSVGEDRIKKYIFGVEAE